jgi:hypothetical protein
MALAVKQSVQGNFSPGKGSLLRGHPIEIENERLAPGFFRRDEQFAEDDDGLAMHVEKRIEGSGGQLFFVDYRQTREALAPAQFRSPDMAHQSLHTRGAANVARQFEQRRVGFEVCLPIGSRLLVPGQQLFQ